MARRHRSSRPRKEPAKPLDGAAEGINTLENAVAFHTASHLFSMEHVIHSFWHDDVIQKLKDAYPIVRELDRTAWAETVPVLIGDEAVSCHFQLKVGDVRMLCPRNGQVRVSNTWHLPIFDAVKGHSDVHRNFEKIRKVVAWLNEHATLGAARHYCPWLQGVLPAEHPFHQVDGKMYREPTEPIYPMVGLMRECGAIMASALLCNRETVEVRNAFTVHFTGWRDGVGSDTRSTYNSQTFGLL